VVDRVEMRRVPVGGIVKGPIRSRILHTDAIGMFVRLIAEFFLM